ncbi:class II D-tagatose-bisphosphate aldolase, non-catalytic subunit [Clostridium tarantellae]|uniref:Tagatose-bisphosphate aldolase n=1 Tax=Clostridium tarantellae TaxID=39493 RepID=A0A6I1MIC9_9CLOT|nr:class II D-tagatose-bisphosphate aldolase, non-catalytic subunit [Clostridium tarantellae]MPQ43306.1 tagatose-bisphosphate aldolase [Clostridium tarantellae]
MLHPIKEIVKNQKAGIPVGIYSVCSSNNYVIEAALERALRNNDYLLIESTANQVNQFGGYTGMRPLDFKEFVYEIADKVGFPREKVILGGDHLGPLVWKGLDEKTAMKYSKDLIREYVLAGFTKIHIDTSMHIGDDLNSGKFGDSLIAERAAILCEVAEAAFSDLKENEINVLHPVYIVGSEVPIPGGSQDEEEEISVTKSENLKNTIDTFKEAFKRYGLDKCFNENVIAVVVQPGVEFGSDTIWAYNRDKAKELVNTLNDYENLIFEAHSTDYQTPIALKELVEDGFAILKVGPALTFALREGLFALSCIEEDLFTNDENVEISKFRDILDFSMVKEPENWKNHYKGSGKEVKFERKYSFSDRARYYLPNAHVDYALHKMICNLNSVSIPLPLISQYMPTQYKRVRMGLIKKDAESLLKDKVNEYIEDYMFATKPSLKIKKKA